MCGWLNVVPGIPRQKARQVHNSKRRARSDTDDTFTSHQGGCRGIYSKSRRCPVVWFLLCLGLTLAALPDNPALAADEMNADQSADRKGGQAGIKGDQDKLKGNEINADQSVESYYGPTFSGRASGGLSRGKAAYMFQFVSHRGFFPLLGSPFFSISYE